MNLKLLYTSKLISAWITSITYLSAINVIRAESETFECGDQNLADSTSDSLFVRKYEYPW